jgi:hypothetical protein
MKTAIKNVKKPAANKPAVKKPAKKGPDAAKPPVPAIDPRLAEKAKALDAAVAKLATPPAKQEAKKAAKSEPNKARKVSALDAAATVLASASKPMRTKDLIAEMAKRGLWTSPGGKTPEATLYAAMVREINTKGPASRFARVDKGAFASRKKGGA